MEDRNRNSSIWAESSLHHQPANDITRLANVSCRL
jgi:hypothetical protein